MEESLVVFFALPGLRAQCVGLHHQVYREDLNQALGSSRQLQTSELALGNFPGLCAAHVAWLARRGYANRPWLAAAPCALLVRYLLRQGKFSDQPAEGLRPLPG